MGVGERWCEPCKSRTHSEKDCWGPCTTCHRRGHKSSMCRKNPNNSEEKGTGETVEVDRANAAQKGGKKKKKKNQGKAALEKAEETPAPVEVETVLEESSASDSEEDSRVKQNNRAARVGLPPGLERNALFKSALNEELSAMSIEESKAWGKQVFSALKAKSARAEDNPVVRAKVHSKLHGGRST